MNTFKEYERAFILQSFLRYKEMFALRLKLRPVLFYSKTLSAFEIYQTYVALKQHFYTDRYDFITRNGKVSCTPASLERRNDKAFFHVLAKEAYPARFLLANLIGNDAWIGDLVKNAESDEVYLKWQKRLQSFSYRFQEDLKKLEKPLDINFRIINKSHPLFFRLFLNGEIAPETATILLDFLRVLPYMNEQLADDLVWEHKKLPLIKYRRFLDYDDATVKLVVKAATK